MATLRFTPLFRPVIRAIPAYHVRAIHTAPPSAASVSPLIGTGPPPEPPTAVPSPEKVAAMTRVARRKKQASMLKEAKRIRGLGGEKTVQRRFWKEVFVGGESEGDYIVKLDHRTVRHPTSKEPMPIPEGKTALAIAVAVEWDQLMENTDTTKGHLLPLTSLTCRALDIAADDASANPTVREGLVSLLLKYLDTDSILCWAPEGELDLKEGVKTLREVQKEASTEVTTWLSTNLWPGIEIIPVLSSNSIFPAKQPAETRARIEAWTRKLDAWDLAGLERAVITGKSFLIAARLVAEWSGNDVGRIGEGRGWGADEAARVASLEVDWQIGRWGEVEDTHDVEKRDTRRHYGSVVLLVSGPSK